MPDRFTVLTMPGYGKQTAEAGRALWNASANMDTVDVRYEGGSLLACNFNVLWCHALNMVHRGQRVDYFAMLHDDVGPTQVGPKEYWLDILIDELEAQELDVLGVAVPIKDTRGMTSIALHHDGDNWEPDCRLSMYDIFELPETFTSSDLGRPLLLNTGCWVCKFDIKWAKMVHFEINDRIVFDVHKNCYRPQNESEDWYFSRLLQEIGRGPTSHVRPLRIGCTRKVTLSHKGEISFGNHQPWGSQAFDVESYARDRKISPVPGAFPRDVDGWLSPSEGKKLAELAHDKRVLEIGSYCGLSTICMARTAKHVTAVDYFDGRNTPSPRDTRDLFMDNIRRYGVADKITTVHPDEVIPGLMPRPHYDMAFIDGSHEYDSVVADVIKATNVLKSGGLLVFHDYKHPSHADIEQVVDGLQLDGFELLSTHETLAVVKSPAAIPLEV